MTSGRRMWDLWWTNCHWDMSLLRSLRLSSLIIIPPMLLLTFRSDVILAMVRVVKTYISLSFCKSQPPPAICS